MDIIDYLPQKMKAEAEAYMPCGLEEIRVRAGKQVQYMFAGGCRAGVYISHSDIERIFIPRDSTAACSRLFYSGGRSSCGNCRADGLRWRKGYSSQ